MKRLLKWAAIPVAILIIASIWFLVGSDEANGPQSQKHMVTRGDLLISVTEPGTLKAVKEIPIRCEVEEGESRVIFLIDEGKTVNKGDLLIEFDSSNLANLVNRQEIEYQSAMSSYKQSKENLEIRKSMNESEIRAAVLQLKFAKMDLEKFKEGEWPLDLKKQESAITLAQDELVRAKARLEWTRVLEKKGYATRADLESDELSVKRKQLEIEQEIERLKMMKAYDYPQRLAKLESDVIKYGQELDRTKRKATAELAQATSDLQAKEANFKNHEDRLKKLRLNLKRTRIMAPQDGLVVYHKDRWRGEAITLGGTAHHRQRLLDLPDTSILTVEVKVHESRIGQLRLDQVAFVTLDTLPGKRFRGKVTQVAPMPDPQSFWNPGLKVYTVDVLIEDPLPPDVKPGLSAKAEIIIDKLESVLAVPIQAITTVNKKQVVYKLAGSKVEMATVAVGQYNDTHASVTEGLSENDQILLAPPSKDEALALGLSVVDGDEVEKSDVVEGRSAQPQSRGKRPTMSGMPVKKAAMPSGKSGMRSSKPGTATAKPSMHGGKSGGK